jgi:hypothetical protein
MAEEQIKDVLFGWSRHKVAALAAVTVLLALLANCASVAAAPFHGVMTRGGSVPRPEVQFVPPELFCGFDFLGCPVEQQFPLAGFGGFVARISVVASARVDIADAHVSGLYTEHSVSNPDPTVCTVTSYDGFLSFSRPGVITVDPGTDPSSIVVGAPGNDIGFGTYRFHVVGPCPLGDGSGPLRADYISAPGGSFLFSDPGITPSGATDINSIQTIDTQVVEYSGVVDGIHLTRLPDADGDGHPDVSDDCPNFYDPTPIHTCPVGPQPQCSDGIDNDADGFIDYPLDLDCSSRDGLSEGGSVEPSAKLEVKKNLVPSTDSGRFNLQIDEQTAGTGGDVGDGGSTGDLPEAAGTHTVSEFAASTDPVTDLSDYTSSTDCKDRASGVSVPTTPVLGGVSVTLHAGDDVVCTITNLSECTNLAAHFKSGWLGNTVSYDGSVSTSKCGIASYNWEFGDGTVGDGPKPSHPYATPGRYSVRLTVTDKAGHSATVVRLITSNPPAAYAPLVHLAPHEIYYPGSADTFVANSQLWYAHGRQDLLTTAGVITGGDCPDHLIAGSVDPRGLGIHSGDPYRHYDNDPVLTGNDPFCQHDTAKFYYASDYTHPEDTTAYKVNSTRDGFYLDLVPHNPNRPLAPNGHVRHGSSAIEAGVTDLLRDPVYYQYKRGRYIAYWFFYPFNYWTHRDLLTGIHETETHEGDWEHIAVKLDARDNATQVLWYLHNCDPTGLEDQHSSWAALKALATGPGPPPDYGLFEDTADLGKLGDHLTHPIVFSALGGHASYFSNGSNGQHHLSCGVAGVPSGGWFDQTGFGDTWLTWQNVEDVTAKDWYGFGGAWGNGPGDNLPPHLSPTAPEGPAPEGSRPPFVPASW